MQRYELLTQYDSRASFYGKATVTVQAHSDTICPVYFYDKVLPNEAGNCSLCGTPFDAEVKTLVSYVTEVATIADDKARVRGVYSNTTLRHIKEFLKQNGFKAENSKQIMADYSERKSPAYINNNGELVNY
jgi:hypothetical protein